MIEGATQRFDRLGLVLCAAGLSAALFLPFLYAKANRIAAGKPVFLADLVDRPVVLLLLACLASTGLLACRPGRTRGAILARLALASLALFSLLLAIGQTAEALTPAGSNAARMSPAAGFWVLIGTVALVIADALAKLRLGALPRLVALAGYLCLLGVCLSSGLLDELSVMKEFSVRSVQFSAEALRHVELALGSLAIATLIGLPLGILCFVSPRLSAGLLGTLSLVQTIPSLALFGLLMLPLGLLAAHVPLAAAIGIRGIGASPALIALVLYALLPIAANTAVGLKGVDPAVREAAAGMGLTRRQILFRIDLPLAFPVILTGIRLVLVQSIGMAAVAALIGGGGFGTFIFQGLGQTAMDLVLLGALPTVALAFSSAVLLDALIDSLGRRST